MSERIQTCQCNKSTTDSLVSNHSKLRDKNRKPLVSRPPLIQTKLTINQPEDEYEQEADRVAEQVMRMPEPGLRRRYAKCDDEIKVLQVKDSPGQGQVTKDQKVPSIVHEVLQSPGMLLDEETRAFMESRFGHDFSRVRVHSDARAAESAQAVNAQAYTSGRHLVFGVGQYSPMTTSGRRLLTHELAHTLQQGLAANPLPQLSGNSNIVLQRDVAAAPRIDFPISEEGSIHSEYRGYEGVDLRNNLWDLADKNVKTYATYRAAISKSTPTEKRVALNTLLLSKLKDTLDYLSFARCVEFLGRRAPTFDELRKNSTVYQAIEDAWKASDVGVHDLVTQAHEEGGWVFMNLIDGSLSIERAKPEGTDFIRLEPPPDVADSVLVAMFHTHPHLGRNARPGRHDLNNDTRRGIPNLVAGNLGTNPRVFQIFLSGPAVRKHLASDTKIPGRSGGIPP